MFVQLIESVNLQDKLPFSGGPSIFLRYFVLLWFVEEEVGFGCGSFFFSFRGNMT